MKTSVLKYFFDKVTDLFNTAILLKKYPVKFAKFLRAPILKNICEWPAAPLIWSMAYEFFSVPKSGRITAWKVSKYGVISGPYFHAFGLNMERYFVSLHIQSQCRKIGTRNYSVFGQFPCSEFSARAQNSAEWKTTTSTLSFSSILRNSTVNFEVSIKIRTMSLVLNEF